MGRHLFKSIVLSLGFTSVAFALDVQISSGLDKSQIPLNEQVLLSVTVTVVGGRVSDFQIPAIPDFQITPVGNSTNIQFVNGQASAAVTHQYALTPLREGTLTIPSIQIKIGDQSKATDPLTLKVLHEGGSVPAPATESAGDATPAPSRTRDVVFVKGSVDKTSAYVGEPVTYTFRFYNRVRLMNDPQYQPPEIENAWREDFDHGPAALTTVNGQKYEVREARSVLFPTHTGSMRVGAATLTIAVEDLGSDPTGGGNIYAMLFGRADVKTLRTEPFTVRVKPLPDPKPAAFDGAVGRFTLSSSLDKTTVAVGDPVTLTVAINGSGNIKSLPTLRMPAVTNFRMFDATSSTTLDKKSGQVQGSKIFKTVMIPITSGDLKIPALSFVFFDPEKRAYQPLESKSFTLRVTPGAPGRAQSAASGPPLPPSAVGVAPAQIQRLSDDIRYIKTPARLASQSRAWIETPFYWGLHAFALLLVVGLGAFRLYQKHFLTNSLKNRFKNSAQRALDSARKAETLADKSQLKASAELLADGYQRYLADKLSLPPQGISLKTVQEALRQKGLLAHDGEKVRNLWETLDLFEFAPTQMRIEDIRQALATFRHVIEELEKDVPWID
jgi:hypothetical protein